MVLNVDPHTTLGYNPDPSTDPDYSFRALADTVRTQQERLGRVEKQFGLPNSAGPAERPSRVNEPDVGWPLDLNQPKDRENVDKAVSFHDL